MKVPYNILFSATLFVCIMAKEDLDFVDTEPARDNEAALKCDACRIVTEKVSLSSIETLCIYIYIPVCCVQTALFLYNYLACLLHTYTKVCGNIYCEKNACTALVNQHNISFNYCIIYLFLCSTIICLPVNILKGNFFFFFLFLFYLVTYKFEDIFGSLRPSV